MPGTITGHLVRRGLHFANDCIKHKQSHNTQAPGFYPGQMHATDQSIPDRMLKRFRSPGALIALGITFISFFIITVALEYSIRIVATHLAIAEATEDAGRIALSSEPDAPLDKAPLLDEFKGEEGQKLPVVEVAFPTQPITRKLRTTFRHLNTIGGFRSRFRGLRFAAFYALAISCFAPIFRVMFGMMPGPIGLLAGRIIPAVLCCNLHAAWTHATVAAPSDKPFFKRFLPGTVARALVLPTLRLQFALVATHVITVVTGRYASEMLRDKSISPWISVNLAILPIALGLVSGFFVILPAYIALIRTEASLLPEDMDAVVPFDRTFGGRFGAQEDAPKRCAFVKNFTLRGAYMTFGRDTYNRVVKMQIKFTVLTVAVTAFFAVVAAVEIFCIAGGEQNIREFIAFAKAH
jgi:hypothetical protein